MTLSFVPKLLIILCVVCAGLYWNIIFCDHKEIQHIQKNHFNNPRVQIVIHKHVRSIWEGICFSIVNLIGAGIGFYLLVNNHPQGTIVTCIATTFAVNILVRDMVLPLIFNIKDLNSMRKAK